MINIINKFSAKTFSEVLSLEESSCLLDFCKNASSWRSIPDSFWHDRTINYLALQDEKIKKIISEKFVKIQKIIKDAYSLNSNVYPDTIDIVRWLPGMEQSPHCDDMSNNEKEHSRFKNRFFGAIVYLNDDFAGGETFYPDHDFKITPETGMLAVHLGDCNHRHGVTKVQNFTRYTIASFWSFDKNSAVREINWV
jgi:hypothetical protein